MPSEIEVYVKVHAPRSVPLACEDGASICENQEATCKKPDAISSDGPMRLDTFVEDSPDRTSSEDDLQQRLHSVRKDAGLLPMVTERVAATTLRVDRANNRERKDTSAAQVGNAVDYARQKPEMRSSSTTKRTKLSTAKPATTIAAMCLPEDWQRKRKTRAKTSLAGISQASARMLFQCSSMLLKSQAMDYDVRARETAERNAMQAKEIVEWETKVHCLKRELEEYMVERPLNKEVGKAMAESDAAALGASGKEAKTLFGTTSTTGHEAVESLVPPAVAVVEAKLQEELRKRKHKLEKLCSSFPGFIDSMDKPDRQLL